MIDGSMQEFALTLDKFLDHAAKWHPRAQVVTGRDGGKIDRVSYADLRARSLRISAHARGFRHWLRRPRGDARLEHAGACRGVVRDHGHGRGLPHTQSATHGAQLASMLAQSGCRVIVVSADLAPLAQQIIERTQTVRASLIIDGPVERWRGERDGPRRRCA